MEFVAQKGDLYILNLARGEELHTALLSFCAEKGMQGATLTGLGACDQIELAYYHLPTKTYERHVVDEELEILSLVGNLGTLDGVKAFHIHGVFGRRDLSTLGGHVFGLRVSGACEVHLSALPVILNRKHDDTTGLNLMCRV